MNKVALNDAFLVRYISKGPTRNRCHVTAIDIIDRRTPNLDPDVFCCEIWSKIVSYLNKHELWQKYSFLSQWWIHTTLKKTPKVCSQYSPPVEDIMCVIFWISHEKNSSELFSNQSYHNFKQKSYHWWAIQRRHGKDHIYACLKLNSGSLRWRHNDHAGVSNHLPHGCLLKRLFRLKSKITSKLRVTGLCAGNSPGTGEFPAQMASYAENVSIWWRHHVWPISKRGSCCETVLISVILVYLVHQTKVGIWCVVGMLCTQCKLAEVWITMVGLLGAVSI